jgi:hypothetical protein
MLQGSGQPRKSHQQASLSQGAPRGGIGTDRDRPLVYLARGSRLAGYPCISIGGNDVKS